MGDYTELLIIGCDFIEETPKEVINALKWIFQIGDKPKKLPQHELFDKERADSLTSQKSTYFPVEECISVMKKNSFGRWFIHSRANIKNQESEIELFIDWISPWINEGSGEKDLWAIVTYEDGPPELYFKNNYLNYEQELW